MRNVRSEQEEREEEQEKRGGENKARGLKWQPKAGMFHFRLTLQ